MNPLASDTAADLAALGVARRAECAAAATTLAVAGRIAESAGFADEWVTCEVATALSVSTGAARGLMDLGHTLATRLPGVRRALEQGVLDVVRVRVIAERTAMIADLDVLAEVEARVLAAVGVPGRCVTRGQVAAATDRVVASVDPAAVIERRRRAVADRCLDVRAGADGMSGVWGLVPAGDGVVLDARLRAMALGVCGADPRTVDQRRADALVAWAHGRAGLGCTCGSPTCPVRPEAPGPVPVVQVVVDAAVLLGASDLPGVLARYGIVDPDTVRTLAADARWQQMLTLDGAPAWLRTATSPGPPTTTPECLRHTPSERLATLVRTRDAQCRFPGCTTPAASCDLDHVVPFDRDDPRAGGPTVVANLACLCRWHHRMKTDQVWQVRMTPDGVQRWAGPHGQQLHSTPTGMPPDGPGPPSTAAPVLPYQRREPSALRAPPADLPDVADPPDDDPPGRFTPDGHWADDPWTETDIDHALDTLLREINTQLRAQQGQGAREHGSAEVCHDDPEDPPPF